MLQPKVRGKHGNKAHEISSTVLEAHSCVDEGIGVVNEVLVDVGVYGEPCEDLYTAGYYLVAQSGNDKLSGDGRPDHELALPGGTAFRLAIMTANCSGAPLKCFLSIR